MVWSTTVHTGLSSDTEPSVIVTFPDAKYIFNAGENTGRAFSQTNGNWRKARAVFFTQSRVERMAGLFGLIMSFADATIDKLSVIGPQGLAHMLASARYFVFRDSIEINPKEIPWASSSPELCYTDSNIKVYAIPVLPFPEAPKLAPIPHSTPLDPAALSSEPLELGKRPREPSPDSPRKRLNPGSSAPGRTILSDELLAEVRNEDVEPSSFTGFLAGEFRQMILKAMFPNTNPRKPLDSEKKKAAEKRSRQGMKAKAAGKSPLPAAEAENVDVEADTYRRSRSSLPNGYHKQLPKFESALPQSSSTPAMSYLLVGPPYRGKFNVERARELGIQGAARGRLTSGQTITIKVTVGDEVMERTIKPEDVLGEGEKPSAILLLDVPSTAHVASLVSTFRETAFYKSILGEDSTQPVSSDLRLRAVYHICGNEVLENEDYKIFMHSFGPEVHHIVASRDLSPDPVTFTSSAYSQLRLNSLDSKIFPIPNYSLTPKKNLASIPSLPPNTQLMSSGLHLIVRPFSPPSIDPELIALDKFHPIRNGLETLDISERMNRAIERAQRNVATTLQKIESGEIAARPPEGKDVGVISLGTGGTLPNKYRNVLSTLIRIPGWGNILLDAGEGTWGQLARHYGLEEEEGSYSAWQALRDLKCIFVSHVHADHHAGIAQLLAKRKTLDPPPEHPLYLVSIRTIHLYLRELSDVQDLGLSDPSGNGVVPIISDALHYRATGEYAKSGMWQVGGNEPWLDFQTSVENGQKMCDSLGLEHFKTVDVYHYCRAYGCSFKHKDDWSITFSGDTRPTDRLVWLGKDSTVLIHESTMSNDELHLAERAGHSTIGEAIDIGKRMNAKNILLTHFGARFPKIPPSIGRSEAGASTKQVIIAACDHARMTIGDMWKMPFYADPLRLNFQETLAAEDNLEEDIRNSKSPSPVRSASVSAAGPSVAGELRKAATG